MVKKTNKVKMDFSSTYQTTNKLLLEAEVESHIANDVLNGNRNRRNGYK